MECVRIASDLDPIMLGLFYVKGGACEHRNVNIVNKDPVPTLVNSFQRNRCGR